MKIIKKIVFVLSIACFFLGLNSCKTRGGSPDQPQIMTGDTETILNLAGTYSGILPCADCEGIETRIILNADSTYLLTMKYLEKGDDVFGQTGTFKWNETDSIITLENMDSAQSPTMYKVGENHLLQLNLEGNVIEGELADKYILNKEE